MNKKLIYPIFFIPVISIANDTFDPGSGKLDMPSVTVGSLCYEVKMQYLGDMKFEIASAEIIQRNMSSERIIVEPDDFSQGSDLSASTSGVQLSAIGTGNISSAVFSVSSPGQASTGSQVFGYNNGSLGGQWYTPTRVLRIDFTIATDFVSVDVKGFDSFDSGKMEIYDEENTLLSTISSNDLVNNLPDTISTSIRSSADISYVLVYGNNISDTVGIDNLQFNKISFNCSK